jgi:hypothetical protein
MDPSFPWVRLFRGYTSMLRFHYIASRFRGFSRNVSKRATEASVAGVAILRVQRRSFPRIRGAFQWKSMERSMEVHSTFRLFWGQLQKVGENERCRDGKLSPTNTQSTEETGVRCMKRYGSFPDTRLNFECLAWAASPNLGLN